MYVLTDDLETVKGKVMSTRELGVGGFRTVRATPNPNVVKKVAHSKVTGAKEANLLEWGIWNLVKGSTFEKFFVPCISVTPKGRYLLMERVIPAVDCYGEFDYDKLSELQCTEEWCNATDWLRRLSIIDIRVDNMSLDGRCLDYGMTNPYTLDVEKAVDNVRQLMGIWAGKE